MRPIYGPARKPLSHPATTDLLRRLTADDVLPEEREQARIRELNDATFRRAILNWFRETEGLK